MTIAIVLAAGKGTRMRSALPKVAHHVAGLPMIAHVQRTVSALPGVSPLYVLGHEHAVVRALLPDSVPTVLQSQQRGTGHAVSVALDAIPAACTEVMVLYGDMPLLTADTLAMLRDQHRAAHVTVSLLSAVLDQPQGYGRVIRNETGEPLAIVEDKWLSDAQRGIREINTGVYALDVAWLRQTLPGLPRHGDGEIYLTDIVARAAEAHSLLVVTDALPEEIIGINDRVGLARADRLMRRRVNEALMVSGVTLIDPDATYIAADASIGTDTVVEPGVIIQSGVSIGERCTIGAQTRIAASSIGDGCRIYASQIEYSSVGDDVTIGPFCHLRAGSTLATGVHLGNFAETKNSTLGTGTKMGHFSYLGDTTVGSDVNIGAGTITANYDGRAKHPTVIGDDVFLGVGTMLRAPVRIGNGAYTGAGSVVLHDIAEHVTVAGVPARELRRRTVQAEDGAGQEED